MAAPVREHRDARPRSHDDQGDVAEQMLMWCAVVSQVVDRAQVLPARSDEVGDLLDMVCTGSLAERHVTTEETAEPH